MPTTALVSGEETQMSLKISDEDELFLSELVDARVKEILGVEAPEEQVELIYNAMVIRVRSIFEGVQNKAYKKGRTDGYFDCDCW